MTPSIPIGLFDVYTAKMQSPLFTMRILTFGWDYPPMRNGGLGVACHGLTEELIEAGAEVIFVLPREQKTVGKPAFRFANEWPGDVKIIEIASFITPYEQAHGFFEMFLPGGKRVRFSRSVIEEAYNYAAAAARIAKEETFDVIHAHDWTSYLAGIAAKAVSGKPLVLHVHATSFDQAGGSNVDPEIYNIERQAFHEANTIVAISNYTRDIVATRYGISGDKVEVVHNGIKPATPPILPPVLAELKARGKKIVFYNGRITIQKGVDYFIRAARRVVDVNKNVVFVISGWGDMEHQIMHLVGSLGLSEHVIFAGALWDEERDRMYQSADLLVMPSVSEPFGLVPLEAIQHGTPVLISKQSGVAEVLTHALKVDFWDIEEMANKMLAALKYPVLNQQLVTEGKKELDRLTWRRAAEKVLTIYHRLIGWFRHEVA
jgi:glycosyltransferase involved in cell wall biosynthesis